MGFINIKQRESAPAASKPRIVTQVQAEQEPPIAVSDGIDLTGKYRPRTFGDVIGQQQVVESIQNMLRGKHTRHAFLFTGPSGTGKTTLARIIATIVGVDKRNLLEIDAASHAGVDDMRAVTELVRYKGIHDGQGDMGLRFVIVDEAHKVSSAAWQSLLKPIEEPPPHVYWAFCTTEPDKVPDTIRTRCAAYNLKTVDDEAIDALLEKINKKEGLGVSPELVAMVARQSKGSPRRAIGYLQQVAGTADKKKALRLLETGIGSEVEAIELARMVCNRKGLNWANAMRIVSALEGDSPESVRLMIVNYAAKALKDAKDPGYLLDVINAFQGICNRSEGWAPIMLSLGKVMFEESAE